MIPNDLMFAQYRFAVKMSKTYDEDGMSEKAKEWCDRAEKIWNERSAINCIDLEPDFIEAMNQLIDTQRKPTKKRF